MDKKILSLSLLTLTLIACSKNTSVIESKVFCFDTLVNSYLYEGNKDNLSDIKSILETYSDLSDNYEDKGINNVYAINHTNDEIKIDEKLYNLLKISFDVSDKGAIYFNPLCGSLSKKWKEALEEGTVLSNEVINDELEKINNSSLDFKDNNIIQRNGEAEIDLGGIAKGYTLDIIYDYLKENEINKYLINAGSSSILLGEKNTKDGLFTVGLKDVNDAYIKLSNCFVSTSSISEQGVTIDGVTYSHIINTNNGSAINENDAVIVISKQGYYGDAMSTSLMNNTVEEIKELENQYDIETIVIKNNKITYQNENIEVYYH